MADKVGPTGPEDLRGRLIRDEIRLAHDEERIEQDERWIRRNWRLALILGGVLALTVVALVLSVVALNRDIDSLAAAAPKDASVGTAALRERRRDGGPARPGRGDPRGARGRGRDEAGDRRRRGDVSCRRGERADRSRHRRGDPWAGALGEEGRDGSTASDADALGGLAAGRYLNRPTVVTTRSSTSTLAAKGPRARSAPPAPGDSGGASIDGAATSRSPPARPTARTSGSRTAAAIGTPSGPWTLEVIAVCGRRLSLSAGTIG